MSWIDPALPHLPVDIEHGITLDELTDRIRAARGKPLRIHELPELGVEGGSLCGLWLATDVEDIILHAPSSSALHREQFILHELAHMLLLHDVVDGKVGYATDGVLADIPRGTVVKALGRDSLDDEYELRAEQLADVLATYIRRRPTSRFSEVFG